MRPVIPLLLLAACSPEAIDDSTRPSWQPGTGALDVPVALVARNAWESRLPIEADGRDERPGGTLYRLEPDGVVTELVTSPVLFDAARPAVSPDGQTIAFTAIETEDDGWSIWTVPATGGVATRLTHPPKNPVQDAIDAGGPEFSQLEGTGDYSPFWLQDGRIGFASTRYPTLAASCGLREPNIYLMQADGSDIRRITTTRSGIVDPWPLADGRIVGAYYSDNMNAPHPEGEGLRPLVPQRHWQARYWNLWAFAPDGSGASRYANVLGGVGEDEAWGVHQAKELIDGRLVATVRKDATLLDMDTYRSGVTIFEPGWVERHEVTGLGIPLDSTDGYAICPMPLPDGRILLSWGQQRSADDGQEIRPDFNLWVVDEDLDPDSMVEVLRLTGTDELDAVPIAAWTGSVIEGGSEVVPTEDPRVDEGTTAYLNCEGVYADLPLGTMEQLSPKPGSVWEVWFWDDTQQLDTEDNPRLNKQMPEFLGSVPVSANGSFTAEVPADRPFFYMLVGPTGVAARMRYSPVEQGEAQQGQDFFVPVHDFLRPNAMASCTGCHVGHMLDHELAMDEARTNLARLAVVESLGSGTGEDDFDTGPGRAVDQRLPEADDRFGWKDDSDGSSVGIQLDWVTELYLDGVRLYPLQAGGEITQIRLLVGTTASTLSNPFADGQEYVDADLLGVGSSSVQVWVSGTPPLGLGEVQVFGTLPAGFPETELAAPTELSLGRDMVLSWTDDRHPMLAGFELLVAREGDKEEDWELRDIGLVASHALLLDEIEPSEHICLRLRPYDITGHESTGGLSEPACADVPELRIDEVEPDSATWGERTQIEVTGAGFRDSEDFMLSLCAYELHEVTVNSEGSLSAWTRRDRPLEPGVCDVEVGFDNGLSTTLEGGFEFVE